VVGGGALTASRLTAADIGAWLFTCAPGEFAEIRRAGAAVDGFCGRPSYRLDLIAPGQPAVLWVSGSSSAEPRPGIWMVGRTTGEIDRGRSRPRIGLALDPLAEPLPRAELRADQRTARLEVLRVPQTSNPSVVSPAEWEAITELLGIG
jgi:hypothetical protein